MGQQANHNPSFDGAEPVFPSPGVIACAQDIWQGFRQENAAFVLVCIYLIFEYNRPQLVYPILDIIPWGKTLLFFAIFLAFFDTVPSRPSVAAVFPLTVFSVCVFWSMAFAFSPSTSAELWVSFFSWVFVVLLLTSVVNTRRRLFLFISVYFLVNLKMAQHGFRSWATGGFGFSSWGVSGSPGWFQNSGEFSLEMVVFIPLVIAYISIYRRDWSQSVRVFFYLFAVMSAGSIIATGSRGGILGLIALLLWGLAYSRKRFKTLILIVLFAALVYQIMPAEFKARFDTAGEDKTSLSRMVYWEIGIQAIRDNPFTGIGFKNWSIWVEAKHPELKGAKGYGDSIEVIHNTYLEAGTELGLPGMTAYIAILLQIFFTNRKSAQMARAQNDRFLTATAIGLNGSLFGFLAPSYFMAVLYYPYIWILLAFTICVSSICKHKILAVPQRVSATSTSLDGL